MTTDQLRGGGSLSKQQALRLRVKPESLLLVSKLNQSEFETLLKSFEVAWQEYIEQEYIQRPRARRYGGGRHAELSSSRTSCYSFWCTSDCIRLRLCKDFCLGWDKHKHANGFTN